MSSDSQNSGLKLDPMYLADLLDERFVAIGRFIDGAAQKSASLLRRTLPEQSKATPDIAVEQRARFLARHARVRLSDLHLRVGQSIYEVDRRGEVGETRQQLCALLEEIERLEEHLGRFDAAGTTEVDDERLATETSEPTPDTGQHEPLADARGSVSPNSKLKEVESLVDDGPLTDL